MEFWRRNDVEQKWEGDPQVLAAGFWSSKTAYPGRVLDADDSLSLDGALRLWIAATGGLDSTWDDQAGFDELHEAARRLTPTGYTTKTGRTITVGDIEEYQAEAERGYDPASLRLSPDIPAQPLLRQPGWPPPDAAEMVPVELELDHDGQPVPAAEGPAWEFPPDTERPAWAPPAELSPEALEEDQPWRAGGEVPGE